MLLFKHSLCDFPSNKLPKEQDHKLLQKRLKVAVAVICVKHSKRKNIETVGKSRFQFNSCDSRAENNPPVR